MNMLLQKQVEKGTIFSLSTTLECEVAEKICEMVPCAEMVRFGKNGTDATSAAIRLARAYTGRDHVIVCGYHGLLFRVAPNGLIFKLDEAGCPIITSKCPLTPQKGYGRATHSKRYVSLVSLFW